MDMNSTKDVKRPEGEFGDILTDILRRGAQKLLIEVIEAEVEGLLASYQDVRLASGHKQVVRNGYLPERDIQTGIGAVKVAVPRVRDRSGSGVCFYPSMLPRYLRKSPSLEELIPWLYLKGVSTGDFSEALSSLLGSQAPGLSASTISRLKESWLDDYEAWLKRDLSDKQYVYFWVDGIYLHPRLEDAHQCLLVIMGADAQGNKELIAIQDGIRESEQSWYELLIDLKHHGLSIPPKLAIGDGALGFWKAVSKVYPQTLHQRCWLHKALNVLNKLPSPLQVKAKGQLQDIWMAETKEGAERAFDLFIEAYQPKYEKATECLLKDKERLLSFYGFPAEHWVHIRTTNPIESTFATIRLRTEKTKGCLSRKTGLAMVFKLMQSAQKRWLKLKGAPKIAEIIRGIQFQDGIAQNNNKENENMKNAA